MSTYLENFQNTCVKISMTYLTEGKEECEWKMRGIKINEKFLRKECAKHENSQHQISLDSNAENSRNVAAWANFLKVRLSILKNVI